MNKVKVSQTQNLPTMNKNKFKMMNSKDKMKSATFSYR